MEMANDFFDEKKKRYAPDYPGIPEPLTVCSVPKCGEPAVTCNGKQSACEKHSGNAAAKKGPPSTVIGLDARRE